MADVSPINRLLVANRGEIARRIMRTAHEMGISTVAVYAEGDAREPFVREADLAIALEGSTARETYLDQQAILDAARRTGADAVHPGYGFLSENAEFASEVVSAGLCWVGPSSEAIAAMGDKIAAKKLMREAGVPTLESVELTGQEDVLVLARELGYPLLVKAAAGGGGKGMRVVESEDALELAIEGAEREADAAFGDGRLFLEPWVRPVRHVEVQILGDMHGNLVHVFERECSIQRRHQKVVEECPSPVVDDRIRRVLGEAALAAGRAIGYHSAGTVEFLFSEGRFWFLEVNTRLQVEHPVTEMVTGIDLVREQLRIAQGLALEFGQDDLAIEGHAIEARVYAEDAAHDFLPAAGEVVAWRPVRASGVRFDAGIETGSRVGIEFDPMIAKVIAHAPTRREAANKLARSLEGTEIHGLENNRDFLVSLLRSAEFLAEDTTTDFLDRVALSARREMSRDALHGALIACAVAAVQSNRASARVLANLPGGWRNSPMPPMRMSFEVGGEPHLVEYRQSGDTSFAVEIQGESYAVVAIAGEPDLEIDGGRSRRGEARLARNRELDLEVDGRRSKWRVIRRDDTWFVQGWGGALQAKQLPRFPVTGEQVASGAARAPMPGKVLDIRVKIGDQVKGGDLLLTLEAMKMEHQITAPVDGRIAELPVRAGDQVDNGTVLVIVAE